MRGERAEIAPRRVRCTGCGARWEPLEWQGFALTERIGPAEVRAMVRDWPDVACVEIRRCGGCGTPIAARAEL